MGKRREKTSLLMDTREPKTLQAMMRGVFGERLEIVTLQEADFVLFDVCGCAVGIERKTITDFLGSLRSGRLINQLERVRQAYLPVILLEGQLKTNDKGTHRGVTTYSGGWSLGALQMSLWEAQRHGARVLYTPGMADTVDTLRCLVNWADRKCINGPADSEGRPQGSAGDGD
jgi:ERCC4-type nuclease